MSKFVFHYDAGHGWLEVPMKDLTDLGIADEVSHFSYMRGDRVYLEEDCDYAIFMKAYKSLCGEYPTVQEVHDGDDSPIRRYARYENRATNP